MNIVFYFRINILDFVQTFFMTLSFVLVSKDAYFQKFI